MAGLMTAVVPMCWVVDLAGDEQEQMMNEEHNVKQGRPSDNDNGQHDPQPQPWLEGADSVADELAGARADGGSDEAVERA